MFDSVLVDHDGRGDEKSANGPSTKRRVSARRKTPPIEDRSAIAEKAIRDTSSSASEQSAQPSSTETDGQIVRAEKAIPLVPSGGARKSPRTNSELPGHPKHAEKASGETPGAERVKPARRTNSRMTDQHNAAAKATQSSSVAGAKHPPHLSGSDTGACLEDQAFFAEKASDEMSQDVQIIIALHRRRRFILKAQSQINRSTESYLARAAGFSPDMPEKERTALWKQVPMVRKAVEKADGRCHFDEKSIALTPSALPHWADVSIILAAAKSREVWDTMRAHTEKQMETAVKKLPIWAWAESVRGLGPGSVAAIIGEAGDLGSYPSKSHLWKRFGLAVIDGERQRKHLNAEKAILHGYNPSRRSVIYVIAESMSKAQMAGDRDEDGNRPKQSGKPVAVPAHPTGPYGEAYYHRKAITAVREGWTPAHQHADALRYMSKKLLCHMRAAWRSA